MSPSAARLLTVILLGASLTGAETGPTASPATIPATQADRRLPERTSRYNVGDLPGRYRDADKRIKLFALKAPPAPLYDGGGREIFRFSNPVMLNVGAFKEMTVAGSAKARWYAWAWRADRKLSGWVAVEDLESRAGPTLTWDDLLDLHLKLESPDWWARFQAACR